MILIDPRFGSQREGQQSSHDIAGALTALGVAVESASLDFGDFAFLGNGPDGPIWVGVELKTIPDFVNGMLSGRLAGHQIPGLVERYQRVYLIVEGFYRAKRGSGLLEVPRGAGWQSLSVGKRPIFWADVEKFITGLEEAGVRVRRTRTTHETARVIASVLHSFWSKDYDEHRSFNVLYRPAVMQLIRDDEDTRRLRQVAACLPGIGWGRSKAVAETFGSIYALTQAEPGAWEGIDGIGKTIAEGAVKAIRTRVKTATPTLPVPASRVSARRRDGARSVRRARPRQNRKLDAGRRAE